MANGRFALRIGRQVLLLPRSKPLLLLAVLFLVSACAKFSPFPASWPINSSPVQSALSTPTPEPTTAGTIEWMKEHSINLRDNGKTFTYTVTSRFMIFLDDTHYPLGELVCEPKWIVGYVSNGSLRRSGYYPIMFEATEEGTCILKDRDFQIRLVVANP